MISTPRRITRLQVAPRRHPFAEGIRAGILASIGATTLAAGPSAERDVLGPATQLLGVGPVLDALEAATDRYDGRQRSRLLALAARWRAAHAVEPALA